MQLNARLGKRLSNFSIDMVQTHSKSPVREFRTPGSVQGRGGNPTPTAIADQENEAGRNGQEE